MHDPLTHCWAPPHIVPQAPQFLASLFSSTHAAPHWVRPAPHVSWQLAFEQTSPPGQTIPQPPQLLGSESVSTQFSPQSLPAHGAGPPSIPVSGSAAPSELSMPASAGSVPSGESPSARASGGLPSGLLPSGLGAPSVPGTVVASASAAPSVLSPASPASTADASPRLGSEGLPINSARPPQATAEKTKTQAAMAPTKSTFVMIYLPGLPGGTPWKTIASRAEMRRLRKARAGALESPNPKPKPEGTVADF
jgi:hypothetical protein